MTVTNPSPDVYGALTEPTTLTMDRICCSHSLEQPEARVRAAATGLMRRPAPR